MQFVALCLLRAQIAPPSAQRSPFEAVPEPPRSSPPKASGPTIEAIAFRGAKMVPTPTLRAVIVSRVGGVCDMETLRRDSQALYNTGRFSEVSWEIEPGSVGAIVRFTVVERPLIQSIEYQGDGAVTIADILERLKLRKVKLGVQTLFDERELPRATAVVEELFAERGRQGSKVTTQVEPVVARSPQQQPQASTVRIIFGIEDQQN